LPQSQLVDPSNLDFSLLAGAPAIDAGVVIPGFTDGYVAAAPDLGAYESGSLPWTAGVGSKPVLIVTHSAPGTVTLTASPEAAFYSLYTSTNLTSSGTWTLVTNAPSVSGDQWSLVMTVTNATNYFCLQTNQGSAWVYPVPPPAPTIFTPPTATTANLGGTAALNVTAAGVGPLFYQWYNHGEAIAGATNSTLNIFPVPATNASYYVVVSNAGGSTTSSVAPLTVNSPYSVAYWRMENQITAPNNQAVPSWPGIADADTNLGQGLFTTGSLPSAIDDLITFNGLSGGPVTLSTNVAPQAMFVNGHSAGNYSYNAEAISNVDGCLFFPQDQYGDEMDFTGPFSLELFFKTDGNRSGSGVMQLIAQGTDTGQTFRYGIDINAAAAGAVRFVVANSSLGQTNVVAVSGANYADGLWHYLLAVGDTLSGTHGQLRLTIVNQDGSQASATNDLPAGFLPLPAEDNGNLFIGRNSYPVSVTPKTFLGFIDEVQITAGVVPDVWRIGRVPRIDNHPQITSVISATNGVSFQWTGAAANDYQVQWTANLSGVWQTIDTLPSADGVASYVDTSPARLNALAGFYRVVLQ
jgi:hypothetical protein